MKYKDTVRIFGLHPEMYAAKMVSGRVYKEYRNYKNFAITSAVDGTHSAGSAHYKGYAIDIRVWGFSDQERAEVADIIQDRLPVGFQVIDEGTHIHIEYDPQKPLEMDL